MSLTKNCYCLHFNIYYAKLIRSLKFLQVFPYLVKMNLWKALPRTHCHIIGNCQSLNRLLPSCHRTNATVPFIMSIGGPSHCFWSLINLFAILPFIISLIHDDSHCRYWSCSHLLLKINQEANTLRFCYFFIWTFNLLYYKIYINQNIII